MGYLGKTNIGILDSDSEVDWTADQGATNIHSGNLPSTVVLDDEAGALHATDALRINGHTVSLYKGDGTSESVVVPDNNTTYSSSDFTHDDLAGFVANEHIDWTTDQGATNINSGNYTDTTYSSSDFTHDDLTGFVSNEHIDWTTDQGSTNIHLNNLPATALTTVQTAATQAAQLSLTAEEGDVVVRSDENKTYMHNGGSAGTMADFTLLATPTDSVTSVDGATGVVTLNHDSLTGFVANEHIDWTTDQGSTNIHSGNYLNTDTTYSSSDFTHDDLTGFVANEHIDWTTDQGATNLHSGNYTDTTYSSSDFTHDDLTGFVANEHIDWTTDQGSTNLHSGNYTDTTYSSSDFTHDDLTGFVANEHIDWTTDQGSTNLHTGNYTNTTYSAGDGLQLSSGEFSVDGWEIGNAVNLSTLRETGIYSQTSNTEANAGTNYPVPYAGILEVVKSRSGSHTIQRYTKISTNDTYQRYYYNGSWTNWVIITSDTDTHLPISDVVNSTSSTTAASSQAVKSAYDRTWASTNHTHTAPTWSEVTSKPTTFPPDSHTHSYLPLAGGTLTGDVSHGDNVKAKFGAGDDLQIYHDGSNSYIKDGGTGGLRLLADADTAIRSADNSTAKAIFGGDVKLYHSGNLKLATTATGVDVTGTVTADGLVVDNSGTLASFYSGDGLTQVLKITNDATYNCLLEGKTNGNLSFKTKANGAGEGIYFLDTADKKRMFIEGTTGDISFYEDTGTTPKFFWDASAESLGIGSTNPSASYSIDATKKIRSSSAAPAFVLQETDTGNQTWTLGSYGGTIALRDTTVAGTTYPLQIQAATPSNTLYLTNSGNVGIGTSSPSSALDVIGEAEFGDGTRGVKLTYSAGNNSGVIDTANTGDTLEFRIANSEKMRIDSSGGLTVDGVVKHSDGSAAAPSITFTDDTNTGIYSSSNDTLNIGTAGVQRAFFNSAGITSATNVYTGSTASFRNYGGVWSATTGVTGNGFNFINSIDGTAATISSTGEAVFSGTVTGSNLSGTNTGDNAGVTSVATSGAITGGTITGTGTISHSAAAGNKHIPTGGAAGQFLKYSASGTAVWATPSYALNDITDMVATADSQSIGVGYAALTNDDGSSNKNTAMGYMAGHLITTGTYNCAFGYYSLRLCTTGGYNTALGPKSLYANTTGFNNTAIGYNALSSNTTGHSSIAIGVNTLDAQTTGNHNLAIGDGALGSTTTGTENIAIGNSCMSGASSALKNVGIGKSSMQTLTTGDENVAVGFDSLRSATTGYNNVAIGQKALRVNVSGFDNVVVGHGAMINDTLSQRCTAVGKDALVNLTTGHKNIAIGYKAGHVLTTGSNNTIIGEMSGSPTSLSDTVIIGAGATERLRVTSSGLSINGTTNATINGDLTATGDITAYSDERLKDDIKTIESPLDKVLALRGVTYDKDGKRGMGVIAQETEAVIPEVVHTAGDEIGTKSVAYGNIVGLLLEAIKEQQAQIDELTKKVAQL
jgi:trimeric autotransporter adhesin